MKKLIAVLMLISVSVSLFAFRAIPEGIEWEMTKDEIESKYDWEEVRNKDPMLISYSLKGDMSGITVDFFRDLGKIASIHQTYKYTEKDYAELMKKYTAEYGLSLKPCLIEERVESFDRLLKKQGEKTMKSKYQLVADSEELFYQEMAFSIIAKGNSDDRFWEGDGMTIRLFHNWKTMTMSWMSPYIGGYLRSIAR